MMIKKGLDSQFSLWLSKQDLQNHEVPLRIKGWANLLESYIREGEAKGIEPQKMVSSFLSTCKIFIIPARPILDGLTTFWEHGDLVKNCLEGPKP